MSRDDAPSTTLRDDVTECLKEIDACVSGSPHPILRGEVENGQRTLTLLTTAQRLMGLQHQALTVLEEASLRIMCSHCGFMHEFATLEEKQMSYQDRIRDHILACPERPERKLMDEVTRLESEVLHAKTAVNAHKRLLAFVEQATRLKKDGEELEDGTEFDMASDDAVETLHLLINDARAILAELK